MTEDSIPSSRVPLFSQFTCSLCLHAAALSLLVSLPVFGSSIGTPPGEYAVTLTSPVDRPPRGETLQKAEHLPAAGSDRDEEAEVGIKDTMEGAEDSIADQMRLTYETAGALSGPAVHPAVPEAPAMRVPSDATVVQEPGLPRPPAATPVPAQLPAEPAKETIAGTGIKTAAIPREKASPNAPGPSAAHVNSAQAPATQPPGQKTEPAKQGVPGDATKTGGRSGAGGDDKTRIGTMTGGSPGAGNGHGLSTLPHPPGAGLLHGIPGEAGGQSTIRREGPVQDISRKDRRGKTEEPAAAIHLPDAFIPRDIKIEVVPEGNAPSGLSLRLGIRAHPADRKRHVKDTERTVEDAEVTTGKEGSGTSASKVLSLVKAEKGVYIFSLENAGSAASVSVVFLFYARTGKEREKRYASISLSPGAVTRFRFLMPEALFWDDTNLFSGSMEDSRSITRFRQDTGLLWKEEKE